MSSGVGLVARRVAAGLYICAVERCPHSVGGPLTWTLREPTGELHALDISGQGLRTVSPAHSTGGSGVAGAARRFSGAKAAIRVPARANTSSGNLRERRSHGHTKTSASTRRASRSISAA